MWTWRPCHKLSETAMRPVIGFLALTVGTVAAAALALYLRIHLTGHDLSAAMGRGKDGALGSQTDGLTFDTMERDLGRVDKSVTCGFTFHNETKRSLKISSVNTSCSCQAVQLDKVLYLPGEAGRFVVRLDPSSQSPGPHSYTVTVDYENPDLLPARLRLRARNGVDLALPSQLTIAASGSRDASASLLLVDYREKPLKVQSTELSSPYLQIEQIASPSVYDGGWKFLYRVTAHGSLIPRGSHSFHVLFKTDDPEHPALRTNVLVDKVPRIRERKGERKGVRLGFID